MSPTKIRFLSSKMLEFINIVELYPSMNVLEWIKKYCFAFGITSHTVFIERMCNVILP